MLISKLGQSKYYLEKPIPDDVQVFYRNRHSSQDMQLPLGQKLYNDKNNALLLSRNQCPIVVILSEVLVHASSIGLFE